MEGRLTTVTAFVTSLLHVVTVLEDCVRRLIYIFCNKSLIYNFCLFIFVQLFTVKINSVWTYGEVKVIIEDCLDKIAAQVTRTRTQPVFTDKTVEMDLSFAVTVCTIHNYF